MGDVIKDFYKSDAPQFKGRSKEKRREMAIAAKLEAERGPQNESATEKPMTPAELALQKRKALLDKQITQKRQQALNKTQVQEGDGDPSQYVESAEDRLRDRRMERGGVGGNQHYDRPPARKATNTELGIKPGKTMAQKEMEKKYGKGKSALDIVKAELQKKHGKGSVK